MTALRNAVVQTKISDEIDYEPSEWHQVLLPDIADLQSGYSYKSAELRDSSDTGMVSIKNFSRDGSFKTSGFKPIEPEKAKPAQWVNVGDVVVAHTDLTQNADIIGRAIQVLDDGGYQKLIASLDLVKVVSKNEHIPNELLAALLGTEDFHRHCLTYVNGTTVLHLSKKALKDYAIWLPNDKRALESLSHLFVAIAHHQAALLKESRALTQLRDALLPKLMSGEIDVSEIEVPTPPNSHLLETNNSVVILL